MSYKLSDFFVGVVDFFSILLPGALLAFLSKEYLAGNAILDSILSKIEGGLQGWALFLVASYLLGHFIFLVASYLDHVYDSLLGRGELNKGKIQALMRRSPRLRGIRDGLRCALIAKKDPHQLSDYVGTIRNRSLGDAENTNMINAFQWAKTNVLLRHPAVAAEINRLEADSKFFRSLVVVLGIVCIALLLNAAWFELGACLVLMGLSFWGYVRRRWKGVELAYTCFIASERMPGQERTPEAAEPQRS